MLFGVCFCLFFSYFSSGLGRLWMARLEETQRCSVVSLAGPSSTCSSQLIAATGNPANFIEKFLQCEEKQNSNFLEKNIQLLSFRLLHLQRSEPHLCFCNQPDLRADSVPAGPQPSTVSSSPCSHLGPSLNKQTKLHFLIINMLVITFPFVVLEFHQSFYFVKVLKSINFLVNSISAAACHQ